MPTPPPPEKRGIEGWRAQRLIDALKPPELSKGLTGRQLRVELERIRASWDEPRLSGWEARSALLDLMPPDSPLVRAGLAYGRVTHHEPFTRLSVETIGQYEAVQSASCLAGLDTGHGPRFSSSCRQYRSRSFSPTPLGRV